MGEFENWIINFDPYIMLFFMVGALFASVKQDTNLHTTFIVCLVMLLIAFVFALVKTRLFNIGRKKCKN